MGTTDAPKIIVGFLIFGKTHIAGSINILDYSKRKSGFEIMFAGRFGPDRLWRVVVVRDVEGVGEFFAVNEVRKCP